MEPSYPRVVRLDSRYRTAGSPTDCVFTLPFNVEFPRGVRCFVSAFSCPHAWFNVDLGLSDKLYVRETRVQSGITYVRCRALQLEAGNYTSLTLPPALQTLMNAGKSFPNASYTVEYLPSQGCLRVQLTGSDTTARFSLPSEDELLSSTWRAANWTGTADDLVPNDLDTMGDLLRLQAVSTPTTSLTTGLLNTSPVDVIYLRSATLASGDSIGPRGESDIIQRIAVTTSYGYNLAYTSNGADSEYFSVQGGFRELRFSLTNVRGRTLDLHGGFWSVELTFSE